MKNVILLGCYEEVFSDVLERTLSFDLKFSKALFGISNQIQIQLTNLFFQNLKKSTYSFLNFLENSLANSGFSLINIPFL